MRLESHTASVWTQLTPLSAPDSAAPHAGLDAAPRAIFVDLEGALVEPLPDNVDPAGLRLRPLALDGLRLLADAGYRLIVVTQQPGLAYGIFSRAALSRLHAALARIAQAQGVHLADFYACPHAPGAGRVDACLCRAPSPGLMRQAARGHGLALAQSWLVGDTLDDIEAGHRAGCRSLLLDVGSETEWRISPLRQPDVRAANLLQAAQAILACGPARAEAAPLARAARPASAAPSRQAGLQQLAARWWGRLAFGHRPTS